MDRAARTRSAAAEGFAAIPGRARAKRRSAASRFRSQQLAGFHQHRRLPQRTQRRRKPRRSHLSDREFLRLLFHGRRAFPSGAAEHAFRPIGWRVLLRSDRRLRAEHRSLHLDHAVSAGAARHAADCDGDRQQPLSHCGRQSRGREELGRTIMDHMGHHHAAGHGQRHERLLVRLSRRIGREQLSLSQRRHSPQRADVRPVQEFQRGPRHFPHSAVRTAIGFDHPFPLHQSTRQR